MGWRIREASIEDYDALCALFAQVERIHYTALPEIFHPSGTPSRPRGYVEEILDDEDAHLFVAEQGDMVIGLAEATLRESHNFTLLTPHRWVDLRDIVVDERFRGVGIGKALLAHVEAWVRSLGVTRIELTVWEFNTSARTLYEHQGFRTLNRAMSKDLDE